MSEQETQQADGAVAVEGADTLSVTDNRTGESYEIEISDRT